MVSIWPVSVLSGLLRAATGQPPCDPRDRLKLYIWDYLNEVRSSRRLERECRRNIEAT